jgi:hypothetical protein
MLYKPNEVTSQIKKLVVLVLSISYSTQKEISKDEEGKMLWTV